MESPYRFELKLIIFKKKYSVVYASGFSYTFIQKPSMTLAPRCA